MAGMKPKGHVKRQPPRLTERAWIGLFNAVEGTDKRFIVKSGDFKVLEHARRSCPFAMIPRCIWVRPIGGRADDD